MRSEDGTSPPAALLEVTRGIAPHIHSLLDAERRPDSRFAHCGIRGLHGFGHDRVVEPYDQVVIDELRAAVDALNAGDIEPFVALIDESSEWRGITRGRLWWKHAPS